MSDWKKFVLELKKTCEQVLEGSPDYKDPKRSSYDDGMDAMAEGIIEMINAKLKEE